MQLHLLTLILLINISIVNSARIRKNVYSSKSTENIGIDAYIYGFSLIVNEITRVQFTNVPQLNAFNAPMGQFLHVRTYPPASYRGVVAPNADTLYSAAWIDLDNEPWVFIHPDMGNRYYILPIHNHWMEIIETPGTRTTGSASATYLLTGPKWNDALPPNVQQRITKRISSPTRYILILGRLYATGTEEDYAAVHKLQDQFLLGPLSVFIKNGNNGLANYTPPSSFNPNPGFNTTDQVRNVITNINISTYFNMMALLMKDNPPFKYDGDIIKNMAQIGLIPGQPFDWSKLSPSDQATLKSVPQLALNKINLSQNGAGIVQNGWFIPKTERYGTDYLRRAYIAAALWPGNLPEDAYYPNTNVDSDGRKLSGNNTYVLHFAKGQTPPVNAFWSITMYTPDMFFVENSLNRYTLSPRNPLVYNSNDGSLDLYFQRTPPTTAKQNNWLPAPEGPFTLMLRLYWSKVSFFSGSYQSWTIPAVKRVV